MRKKILSPFIFIIFCLAVGCEQVLSDLMPPPPNPIATCLTPNNSEEDVNACLKQSLAINKPTQVIILQFDKQQAIEQWIMELSEQAQATLARYKIETTAVNRSDQTLTIDFINQYTAEQALNYLKHDDIPLTQTSNQLILSKQEIEKYYDHYVHQYAETLSYRLKKLDLEHATAEPYDDGYIVILIPEETKYSQQDIIKQLGAVNYFEIRLAYQDKEAFQQLAGDKLIPSDREVLSMADGSSVLVSRKIYMTEHDLKKVYIKNDERYNKPYLGIEFNTEGTKRFYQLTKNNVNQKLAVVIKNGITGESKIIVVAAVMGPIEYGRVSVFNSSESEIKDMTDSVNTSILRVPLIIKLTTTIK